MKKGEGEQQGKVTKHFNKIEEKILRVMFQQKIPLTIYEIAKECGLSYPTAKKYVEELLRKSVINEEGEGHYAGTKKEKS